MQKKLMSWAFAGLAIFLFVACDGGKGGGAGPDVSRPPELTGKAVVFGKIVDANTGLGIGGAQVKLEIGNVYELVTQSFPVAAPVAEPAKSDLSLNVPWNKSVEKAEDVAPPKLIIPDTSVATTPLSDGDFLFRDIPVGQHKLTISAVGFASYSFVVDVPETKEVNYINVAGYDFNIKLYKSFDAQVVVTAESLPASGISVYLNQGATNEKVAQTDESGVATFVGLDQTVFYTILIPAADIDKDGKYDHSTFVGGNGQHRYGNTVLAVWPVVLTKIEPGAIPTVIASSCDKYIEVVAGRCVVQSGEAIRYVFSQPVQLQEDRKTTFTGTDWAVQRANANDDAPLHEPTATLAMSAANAVLTVTPDEVLKNNYYYAYKMTPFRLSYTAARALSTIDGDVIAGRDFYVTPAEPFDVAAISYDNYITVANANARYNLKFPKAVVGEVTLLAYTKAGAVTNLDENDDAHQPIKVALGGLIDTPKADHVGMPAASVALFGCNAATPKVCGTNEIHYIYGAYNPNGVDGRPLNLQDNEAASANNITIHIVATDAQGVQIDKTVTLPVL